MDDLEQKLSSLLQDPAALERVGSLLQALGTEESPAAASPAPEPVAAAPSLDGLLSQLTPLLTASTGKDPDTALLQALRPYLHGQREKRLDDALNVMRLKELLPLLTRS